MPVCVSRDVYYGPVPLTPFKHPQGRKYGFLEAAQSAPPTLGRVRQRLERGRHLALSPQFVNRHRRRVYLLQDHLLDRTWFNSFFIINALRARQIRTFTGVYKLSGLAQFEQYVVRGARQDGSFPNQGVGTLCPRGKR